VFVFVAYGRNTFIIPIEKLITKLCVSNVFCQSIYIYIYVYTYIACALYKYCKILPSPSLDFVVFYFSFVSVLSC